MAMGTCLGSDKIEKGIRVVIESPFVTGAVQVQHKPHPQPSPLEEVGRLVWNYNYNDFLTGYDR